MKRIKIITSAITLASMFAGIAPAYAVESVTITPKTALASAKLNARVEPSGSNVTYQWVSGDSENGPFTPIYKANDAQYVYSTLDKGKYVTVEVTDKDTGEIFQSSDVRIAAKLGPVSASSLSHADTPSEYKFYIDGQGFILLDEFADKNSTYYILSESTYGERNFDSEGCAKFSIEKEDNIGFYLNNTGYELLPKVIADNIDANHIWWTEAGLTGGDCPDDYSVVCGINLISMSEAVKYQNRIGCSPEGKNGAWWLRTQRGRSGREDNILTVSGRENNIAVNKMADVVCTEEKGVRPAFYLNENFFGSVKVDVENTGEFVRGIIKEKYTKEDLEEIYSAEELVQLGFPAEAGTVLKKAHISADAAEIGAEVTLKAELEISGADGYEYQWIESTSEEGEFKEIKNATDSEYFITTIDKNKYLNCRITPVFDGEKQEVHIPKESVFVENLGYVKEISFPEAKRKEAEFTPAENKFTISGYDNSRSYVLLDSFNDKEAEFLIMADYGTGPIEADSEDPGIIDPNKEGNIGYWLSNNFLEDGYEIAGIHKDGIEPEFLPYLDYEHEWWCESGIYGRTDTTGDYSYKGPFSVLSHSEAMKYYGVYGWHIATEHGEWPLHYWTRTSSDSTDSFFCGYNGGSFNDMTGNYNVRAVPPIPSGHEEIVPRPIFYVSHDFFLKVGLSNVGENVKKAIRSSYTVQELLASGKTMESLKEMGWISIPEAENVSIGGVSKVNGVLRGEYDFVSETDKAEGKTECGFEISSDAEFKDKKKAVGTEYTIGSGDNNKFIRFYVQPCDSDGVTGETVYTEPVYVCGTASVISIDAKIVTDGGGKLSSIAGVSAVRPKAVLKNISSESKSVTVMMWLYDRNNLALANKAVKVNIGAGETAEITNPTLSVKNAPNGSYVRLYIIDDLAKMVSILTEQVEVR